MTRDEVKARVRAVLALMKPEWRMALWSKSGGWRAFQEKPHYSSSIGGWVTLSYYVDMGPFGLPPFPGGPQDSLVERE